MEIDKGRLGQFFLVIGLIMLVIFFATDQARHPQYELFFFGALITGLGGYLIWRHFKPPVSESQRFRALRKMRAGNKEKKH